MSRSAFRASSIGVNDAKSDDTSVPPATRPRPLQVIRDSLNFDTTKQPSATRPTGNGPLKKIVNALTGQPHKDATEKAATNDAASEPAA